MSIIDAYDKSKPMVSPANFYERIQKLSDICIATFKDSVRDKVLSTHKYVEFDGLHSANGRMPIYYLEDEGVLFFMSPIGSAVAGSAIQELSYITGASKFIFFGSCGTLDESAKGKIIIPNMAYRDEGFSYHYMPASDYISVKNHIIVEKVFDECNVDYVVGKTWTTDAFFMETENKVASRRKDGCVSVEMECSGLQAVCDYLGTDLYMFFFSGDLLLENWERGELGGALEKARQADCFDLALNIARSLCKSKDSFNE